MPMDGDAIYKNFWDDAHGTSDYETAQDTITKANGLIGEVGDEVHKHAADLEGYWKGDAADAAKQGLGPIANESQYSRERTDKAWDMLCQQSLDFHDKKNTVQKMPDKPGGLVDGLEAAATAGISAYVKQKNYNDTGMGNVKAMNDWTSATNTRTSTLPPVPPSSLHEKGGVVPTTQTHGNVGDPSGLTSSTGSPSGSTAASATGALPTSAPSAGATATPHARSAPEQTSAASASPSYASPASSSVSPSSPSSSYRGYKSSPSQSSPATASAVPGAKSTPEPDYTPSNSYKDYKPLSDTGGTSAAGFEGAPLSPTELGGGSSSYVPTTSTPPVSSNTPGTYSGLGLTSGAPLAEEPGASGRMSGNIGSGARSGGVPGSGARSGVAEPTAGAVRVPRLRVLAAVPLVLLDVLARRARRWAPDAARARVTRRSISAGSWPTSSSTTA